MDRNNTYRLLSVDDSGRRELLAPRYDGDGGDAIFSVAFVCDQFHCGLGCGSLRNARVRARI